MGKDATLLQTRAWWEILAVVVAASVCFFPNLGQHSLWDVDEARNAECAREMWEAGDFLVPTFNFELRTDKPVLSYWAMMLSFACFGVSEWSARLPSALAAVGTVVLTWWLGRQIFCRWAALWGALLLPGAVLFNVLGHAVTPDAWLILWTTAALACAWWGIHRRLTYWLVWFGVFTGLATLTKGIVGILLPMAVVGLFLIWEKRLYLVASRWLFLGIVAFLVVALPWYVAVGVATKGDWLVGFFGRHHFERFTTALEGHSGGIWYHPAMLLVGFAPWSGWLIVAVGALFRELRRQGKWRRRSGLTFSDPETGTAADPTTEMLSEKEASGLRFLVLWIAVWLVFFSCAQTKLPNYVAPIYPALALVCGWWLAAWANYRVRVPDWLMGTTMLGLALVGIAVSIGLMLACGWIPCGMLLGRTIHDLAWLAWLGMVPVLAAAGSWYAWQAEKRRCAIAVVVAGGLLFVATGAAFGPVLVDNAKISHRLGRAIRESQQEPEIRVACYGWFEPSIVFYVGRPVANLRQVQEARKWLEHPLESYLVVSQPWWEERLRLRLHKPYTILQRYWDFTRGREILLVVNRPPPATASADSSQSSFHQQPIQLRQMVPARDVGQGSSGGSESFPGGSVATQ